MFALVPIKQTRTSTHAHDSFSISSPNDGLSDTLDSDDATFTVFAPVNPAFEAIDAHELTNDSDLLTEVLTYHIIPGTAIEADDISDGQTVETLEGDTLRFSVSGNSVTVNGTPVTTTDVEASNGVVHLVDGVLLETVDAVDRAKLTPQLSTTASAIAAAGRDADDSPLRTDKLTLFAPADGGFQNLDVGTLTNDADLLGRILSYHAVPGQRFTTTLDVTLFDGLRARTHWQGNWGRSWGLRRAYYDYLALAEDNPLPGHNLSRPGDQSLAPFSRLDVGLHATTTVNGLTVEAQVNIVNVLGRHNAFDQSLTPGSVPTPINHTLPGRRAFVRLRLSY